MGRTEKEVIFFSCFAIDLMFVLLLQVFSSNLYCIKVFEMFIMFRPHLIGYSYDIVILFYIYSDHSEKPNQLGQKLKRTSQVSLGQCRQLAAVFYYYWNSSLKNVHIYIIIIFVFKFVFHGYMVRTASCERLSSNSVFSYVLVDFHSF